MTSKTQCNHTQSCNTTSHLQELPSILKFDLSHCGYHFLGGTTQDKATVVLLEFALQFWPIIMQGRGVDNFLEVGWLKATHVKFLHYHTHFCMTTPLYYNVCQKICEGFSPPSPPHLQGVVTYICCLLNCLQLRSRSKIALDCLIVPFQNLFCLFYSASLY